MSGTVETRQESYDFLAPKEWAVSRRVSRATKQEIENLGRHKCRDATIDLLDPNLLQVLQFWKDFCQGVDDGKMKKVTCRGPWVGQKAFAQIIFSPLGSNSTWFGDLINASKEIEMNAIDLFTLLDQVDQVTNRQRIHIQEVGITSSSRLHSGEALEMLLQKMASGNIVVDRLIIWISFDLLQRSDYTGLKELIARFCLPSRLPTYLVIPDNDVLDPNLLRILFELNMSKFVMSPEVGARHNRSIQTLLEIVDGVEVIYRQDLVKNGSLWARRGPFALINRL
jgi:hypothetical protein